MSGEATAQSHSGPESLDRAFGAQARCSRCAHSVDAYRVIALFLHDLAAVRAYCSACYPIALAGEYHARGDGVLLGYADFARRFGSPGPPPPPATSAERAFAALLSAPDLRFLVPPSEGLARRRGPSPYPVDVEFELAGRNHRAKFLLDNEGRGSALRGDESACARVHEMLAFSAGPSY